MNFRSPSPLMYRNDTMKSFQNDTPSIFSGIVKKTNNRYSSHNLYEQNNPILQSTESTNFFSKYTSKIEKLFLNRKATIFYKIAGLYGTIRFIKKTMLLFCRIFDQTLKQRKKIGFIKIKRELLLGKIFEKEKLISSQIFDLGNSKDLQLTAPSAKLRRSCTMLTDRYFISKGRKSNNRSSVKQFSQNNPYK